ncbi:MAG: hypothetical protein ACLFSC_01750 [Wenzhouxiangella sp.]
MALIMLAAPAFAFKATGGLTGWWEQPDEQNHGLIIAISRLPGGDQTGVAFWAHYDDDGDPTWLLAQGPLRGNRIEGDLYQVQGVRFMQPKGMAEAAEEKVGSLEIVFENCDQGRVDYQSELPMVGSGSFEIQRLTTVPGMDCSGGVSDNVPPSARPQRLEIDLEPAPESPDARGEAEWMMTPGSVEFEVEIEYVEAGEYTVEVGGEPVGTIVASVDDDDDGAEGEIEFRSPERGDKPLLDFDPRGQTIEVLSGTAVVLSGTLPEEGEPVGGGKEPGAGGEDIEVEMVNAGVYPDGEAEAEWEFDDGVQTFEIEVEDIPVGDYRVFVNAIEVGVIGVREDDDDDDTEGELEFRSPPLAGFPELDFDPRGALIDIVEGESLDSGTVIFFVEFPATGDDQDDPGKGGPGGKGPGPEIEFEVPKVTDEADYIDAKAKAELDIDDDGREFEVEIEDVPAGTYTLQVGGEVRGSIVAVVDDDDDDDGFEAEGEIEFSEEDDGDDLPLDFSVRGELIEIIADGGLIIFSGTFPSN